MTAHRTAPALLSPGDVWLRHGNLLTVTGVLHEPAAGTVKVWARRMIGTPTMVVIREEKPVTVIRDEDGKPPEIKATGWDRAPGPNPPHPR